jgi:hypothetical protein
MTTGQRYIRWKFLQCYRDPYLRKLAAGKTSMEAIRCLKRRLSDVVYRQMTNDAKVQGTGPGGHVGTATGSSAIGSNPCTGTSERSLPGPAANDPTPNQACEPARSSGRSGTHSLRRERHPLDIEGCHDRRLDGLPGHVPILLWTHNDLPTRQSPAG